MKTFLIFVLMLTGCGKSKPDHYAEQSIIATPIQSVAVKKEKHGHKKSKSRQVVHQIKKGLFIGGEK